MIKKIVIGGAAAALVVAGAASASTLGDINDPTLAAGGFDVDGVETIDGGAQVDFTVATSNSQGNPKGVFVTGMTVSGLVDADGKYLQGNLTKGENSMFSYTLTPATEIVDGQVTYTFDMHKVPAEQLTGAHLFVTDSK